VAWYIRGVSRAVVLLVAVVTGCSDKSEPPPPQPAASPPADAGSDGITVIPGFDPESGMHLDDDGPQVRPVQGRSRRTAEPIGIMLKSTPPGAIVAVDGEQLGRTPKYWPGQADGREHEFTFNLERHAMARYRFVPVASGVIHATLTPVTTDTRDAGLGPVIAPTFAPDATIARPPTVLVPADAAPRLVPPDAAPSATAPAPDATPVTPVTPTAPPAGGPATPDPTPRTGPTP
jgi:hypothetical protein